jgi:hypothetical protein
MSDHYQHWIIEMAKAAKRVRKEWTKENLRELKMHSKAKTPVAKISKAMKRTVGALRQKAYGLGFGLGHQR